MGPLESPRDGGAACGGGGGWWPAVSPISSSNYYLSLSLFVIIFLLLQRNKTSVFVILLEAGSWKIESKRGESLDYVKVPCTLFCEGGALFINNNKMILS